MFFLIRVAFWLSVVLVLLPSGGSQKAPQSGRSAPREAVGGRRAPPCPT